jgi:hypothetical protein
VVEPVETPFSFRRSNRFPVVELVETHNVTVNTFDTGPLPGKQGNPTRHDLHPRYPSTGIASETMEPRPTTVLFSSPLRLRKSSPPIADNYEQCRWQVAK